MVVALAVAQNFGRGWQKRLNGLTASTTPQGLNRQGRHRDRNCALRLVLSQLYSLS